MFLYIRIFCVFIMKCISIKNNYYWISIERCGLCQIVCCLFHCHYHEWPALKSPAIYLLIKSFRIISDVFSRTPPLSFDVMNFELIRSWRQSRTNALLKNEVDISSLCQIARLLDCEITPTLMTHVRARTIGGSRF